MKFKNLGLVVISAALFCQAALAADNTFTYKNQRGSQLTLHFTSTDTLTGTFTTAVASKECQEAIGMNRPVVGLIAKDAITFSVNYPECGSVVTFIGNLAENKKAIDTTAIIAHSSTEVGSRMIGHDVFKRIA